MLHGRNASESNTPSVGPHESVEVDDLRWRLLHAEQRPTIGSGAIAATANGVFVVTDLREQKERNGHDDE
jgi:hypothetical protein